jgi:hypothetical protein
MSVGQENHELLATEAREQVVASQLPAAGVADRQQHLVAEQMPVPVVDGLEVVDVEEHDALGHRMRRGRGSCGNAVHEEAPTVGLGQHVVVGDLAEGLTGQGQVLDQAEDGEG